MAFTIRPISSQRRRRKPRLRRTIGPLITVALFVFFAGAISLAAMTAWVRRDLPNPNTLLDRTVAQSTKIYDRTGEELLYDIHGTERRTLVKLDELPDYVISATIAIEDKNFYKHRGFVLHSIFRAALANIFRGGRVQGASTITQQFVKNAVLTPEKTLARKIREFILSVEIERRFSKDEILQLYFNEIPYGRTNYGVEAASQNYFRKSAQELTLAEAATLAALPQAPTAYLNNPERLEARRDLILSLMEDQDYISKEAADQAQASPLTIKPRRENIEAAHFVLWVKEMLTEKYGERMVEQGGLKVITTLDFEKQKAAEEAVANGIEKIEANGGSNAALVALDPKTGHILAMVGSRDYFNEEYDGAVNVTLRPRQPGSSFKPFVYTASFIKGYTPTTVLYDVVTTFKVEPKDYEPHNYDLKERGPVTVRQALQGSLNIPAVKMLYLTGVSQVLDFAESLGYTTFDERSRFGLSLVLGGGEVKLLDHTSAYAVLANGGVRQAPVAILRVEDARGTVLEEWREQGGRRVADQEIVRTTTDILQDNRARAFIFGENSYLVLPDRPVAAKTGTTNDYRDAWILGYVPSLAAGVWAGNNNNEAMVNGAGGSRLAAPIWNAFMREALKGVAPEPFEPPTPEITGVPVLDGQIAGEVRVRIDKASGLLATERTPINWIEERTYKVHHPILHYIRKDDPRGEPPVDPSIDPQYVDWESAIIRWANETQNQANEAPPTLPDNLHVPANQPSLTVNSPTSNAVVSRQVPISIQVSAPRGVARVTYVVDGALITTRSNAPFDGTVSLPNSLSRGSHTLTITAYDDIDNSRSKNITISLQ